MQGNRELRNRITTLLLIAQTMNRCRNPSPKIHKTRRLTSIAHGQDRAFAKQPPKGDKITRFLAGHRDQAPGRRLVVDDADHHLVGDDRHNRGRIDRADALFIYPAKFFYHIE